MELFSGYRKVEITSRCADRLVRNDDVSQSTGCWFLVAGHSHGALPAGETRATENDSGEDIQLAANQHIGRHGLSELGLHQRRDAGGKVEIPERDQAQAEGPKTYPPCGLLITTQRGSQEAPVNSRFAVNDMRVLAQACVAGLGIALLPQLIVKPIIAQGKPVRVLPTYRRASTDLGLQLVYTSRPPVPPAVAVFAEFPLETLGEAVTNPSQNHA